MGRRANKAEQATKRNETRRLADMVSEVCEQFGCPEPGPALAYYAAGVDPRRQHALLHEVRALAERFPDRLPSEDVWCSIATRLLDLVPFVPVTREESLRATQSLVPYLYAKRSEVELTGKVDIPSVKVNQADIVNALKDLGAVI